MFSIGARIKMNHYIRQKRKKGMLSLVGILLVTHGSFSKGITESVHLIAGEQERLETLSLMPDDNVVLFKEQALKLIQKLDEGDGVLVLVDMMGGSPFNVIASTLVNPNVECITGLNLPMLLAALEIRSGTPIKEMAKTCVEVGADGIVDIRKKLQI